MISSTLYKHDSRHGSNTFLVDFQEDLTIRHCKTVWSTKYIKIEFQIIILGTHIYKEIQFMAENIQLTIREAILKRIY